MITWQPRVSSASFEESRLNAAFPPDAGAAEPSLAALAASLPPDTLSTAPAVLASFSTDWSGDHHGRPLAVARPRSTGEVSHLLRACSRLRIPVVPQGGLTGLVGAAVAEDGRELVLSLDRMRAVRHLSAADFAMVVEGGCVLADAKAAAESVGCLLPVSFGAQGSCRIGGVVATNAGGWNVLRYGMARDLVLGLEVVLSDGRVWNGLRMLRKDNRGYDLKQMFIGSEGTLGVVTAAALKLFPRPRQVETALVGPRSAEAAMALYARMRGATGDLATAFELLLRDAVAVSLEADPSLSDPMADRWPAYVLLELSAGGGFDLRAVLENALVESDDLVGDAVVASSQAQAERLWRLRETMVEHQGRGGAYLRTDISLLASQIPSFIKRSRAMLKAADPEAGVLVYGHVGDGNLHLNVIPPRGAAHDAQAALFRAAEKALFALLDEYGGSLSAEHGIGRAKRDAFLQRLDPVSLSLATGLKSMLDPDGLLSMGRILAAPPTPTSAA